MHVVFFILVIRICVFTIFSHQTLVYICSTSSSSSVVGTVCCPRAKEVGEKTATTTSEPRLKVPRPTWQQQLARQRQNTFLRLLFSSITFSQRGIPTLATYRDSQIMWPSGDYGQDRGLGVIGRWLFKSCLLSIVFGCLMTNSIPTCWQLSLCSILLNRYLNTNLSRFLIQFTDLLD